MDMTQILSYLPMVAYLLLGVGANYLLMQYRRRRDLQTWANKLRFDGAKAIQNEEFRKAELADAEAKLSQLDKPNPVVPIRRGQVIFIQIVPKFIFFTGVAAVVITFFGLFRPQLGGGNANWMIYVGPGMLAVTAILILLCEKTWSGYARVQQLNRKYLMLKVGADFDQTLETLDELLEYYPEVPEMRVEQADRLAMAGRMDDAIATVKKAQQMVPNNADFKMIEVTFQLRTGNLKAASDALDEFSRMAQRPSDPRFELYSAAIALKQNNHGKALEFAEKALEKDSAFAEKLLPRDASLAELYALLQNKGLVETPENPENDGENEAEEDDSET